MAIAVRCKCGQAILEGKTHCRCGISMEVAMSLEVKNSIMAAQAKALDDVATKTKEILNSIKASLRSLQYVR